MSELRSALRRAVRDDSAVIVVDLGLASMADAGVVAPLVEAARLGQVFGAEVVVATAPGELATTLASCGFVDRRRRRTPVVDPPAPLNAARRRPRGDLPD
ncbi:hypothetical protein acdb102_46040 [Acidothermaceae bacterium B102]|nr:hypothetical protein acdb102_46040 [Acidothermaceae bacterium B102]